VGNDLHEQLLIRFLRENERLMNDLHAARRLDLPQCFVAAGRIRNYVWDRLHGYEDRGKHHDIDVVYYDPDDLSEERDVTLEYELIRETGNEAWSVKNQARMHVRNGEAPYRSVADSLARWPETATAVGVMVDAGNAIAICAPHGLDDLFGMIVRQSPLFGDRTYVLERVRAKRWKEHWPLLTVL
jgi:hypothetical protein